MKFKYMRIIIEMNDSTKSGRIFPYDLDHYEELKQLLINIINTDGLLGLETADGELLMSADMVRQAILSLHVWEQREEITHNPPF